MRYLTLLLIILPGFSTSTLAARVPSPLKEVNIAVKVNSDPITGLYTYDYTVTNPQINDSDISAIDIFISRDPVSDQETASNGLNHCPRYHKASSAKALSKYSMVAVGSKSPNNWSCGYAQLRGNQSGSFGWGTSSTRLLKPGNTVTGFALTAYAPPGVREVLVTVDVDYDQLPDEYSENIEKTKELTKSINWLGKTIGPKAPPKVFNATSFSEYLRTLTTQAVVQNWVRDQGFLKSLEAKLDQITKKITASDYATARNVLNAFLSEVDAQKGKHLSLEGYALLYFNGKYLLSNLPEKVKAPAN